MKKDIVLFMMMGATISIINLSFYNRRMENVNPETDFLPSVQSYNFPIIEPRT